VQQGGCSVPFAAKLSPDGSSLQYSTLLQFFTANGQPNAASEQIQPVKVAVDPSGSLYVAGGTAGNLTSPVPLMPLPVTVGAYQTTRLESFSGFVMKVNPTGSGLDYATYVGGSSTNQSVTGVAVDQAGSAYLVGSATAGYPTTPGAYQTANADPAGGYTDGYISKLSPDGSSLVYSTYFGGPENDEALGIALDSQRNAAIVGRGFNTPGKLYSACPGIQYASFVAKLNASGSSLLYSNRYCGLAEFAAIAIDGLDNSYVVGDTSNPTLFPLLNPIQAGFGNGQTEVVAKFDSSGTVVWSTFFGVYALFSGGTVPVAVDSAGSLYFLGPGSITPPITPNALQQEFGGNSPYFLAKIAASLGAPVPVVSPFSVSFGNQLVGVPSSSVDVSIGNFGDADLSAPTFTITGDFSQTNNCSSGVAAGQKCDVNVLFTPTAAGKRMGTLTVNFGGTIASQTVALSGTGTASGVSAAPGSLTFPPQALGITSTAQQLVINNNGTGPLSITSIQTTGDFAQTDACGAPVAAGSNCAVQVTFTPTALGVRNGVLTLTDNAPNSPQTVTLTGTGSNAAASLAPTSLTFASQGVGTSSAAQQVVITNAGTGSLTISSLQTTGDFSQTNGCTAAVAPGANCSVKVTFTPTTSGTRTGMLTITDNAPGTPQTVSLTGTGASLALAVASGSSNAATVQAGGNASYTLSIGGAGFSGTASLSCAGAPTGANCSVPATMSVSATSASTFSLAMSTTPRTLAFNKPFGNSRISWLWATALLGLLMTSNAGQRKRGVRSLFWLLPLLLVLVRSAAGCASGGPKTNPNGTPAGTYTLTVTATSGSTSQSVNLTLIVQ
jgi:hypothetical protein